MSTSGSYFTALFSTLGIEGVGASSRGLGYKSLNEESPVGRTSFRSILLVFKTIADELIHSCTMQLEILNNLLVKHR